jgi:predicted nuclease with TOPRIM domain
MTRQQIIKSLTGIVGGLTTITGLHSYYLSVKDLSNKELLQKIEEFKKIIENNNNTTESQITSIRNHMNELDKNLNTLKEIIENSNGRDPKETLNNIITELQKEEFQKAFTTLNKNTENTLSKSSEIISQIAETENNNSSITEQAKKLCSNFYKQHNDSSDSIKDLNNKLIDIFNKNNNSSILEELEKFRQDYYDWIHSLSLIKQGAVIHTIIFLILFIYLFSLITIYYSDSLLKYFKIEEKFPRLLRFIQLRRKFQQYYFFISILIMIIFLLIGLMFNIWIFFFTNL